MDGEGGGVVDGRSRLLDGLVMATVRVLVEGRSGLECWGLLHPVVMYE